MSGFWARQGIVPNLRWGFAALTLFMVGDGLESGFLSPYLDEHGFGSGQASWLAGALAETFGPQRVMLTVVSRAAWRAVRSHFVVCAADRACTPDVQRRLASRTGSCSELRGEPLADAVRAGRTGRRDHRLREGGDGVSAPVAIVTGGAGGLGQAIASALLSDRALAITGEVLHVTAGTHLAPFIS